LSIIVAFAPIVTTTSASALEAVVTDVNSEEVE
jgi:hypothetical protein